MRDVLRAVIESPGMVVLAAFLVTYPLWSSVLWGVFALAFRRRSAGRRWVIPEPADLDAARAMFSTVTVLIPARNEQTLIGTAISRALDLDWPSINVIVVDDGSTDETRQRVLPFLRDSRVRLLSKRNNEGKAMGLNDGLLLARGDLVLILDADGWPDRDVLRRMAPLFVRIPDLGAVTGNPRVSDTSSLLAKLQAIEFSASVSVQRRGHAAWGRLNTVSGLCILIRRDAAFAVGGFRPDMATEDIAMTWQLQLAGFDVLYEPSALFGMEVPSSLRAWWAQRRRWASGLGEVLRAYGPTALRFKNRWMWPVMLQDVLSLLWCHIFFFLLVAAILAAIFGVPQVSWAFLPGFAGMLIALAGLVQISIGFWLDGRYDPGVRKMAPWSPLYPLGYWFLMALTAVRGAIPGFFRRRRGAVTWGQERPTARATGTAP